MSQMFNDMVPRESRSRFRARYVCCFPKPRVAPMGATLDIPDPFRAKRHAWADLQHLQCQGDGLGRGEEVFRAFLGRAECCEFARFAQICVMRVAAGQNAGPM
eukprot:4591255-Pyramimonas_sp.AAC.1